MFCDEILVHRIGVKLGILKSVFYEYFKVAKS